MVSIYGSPAAVFLTEICFLLLSFVSKAQHFTLALVTYG
jgi:hypothetical protein